jgi:catechol 2,3-dioxygenase-like lactoylglutathione lyase family enzyme
MTAFLHTMVRITDPERSRAFYEALGFTFARDMDIVRDGELRPRLHPERGAHPGLGQPSGTL